jgi:hypothetical protein
MSNGVGTYVGRAAAISLNYTINDHIKAGPYRIHFYSPPVIEKDFRFRLPEGFPILLEVQCEALGRSRRSDDVGTDPFVVGVHGGERR